MASAHPTPEMLSAYAAGGASEGVSLLVATHLTFCPACRARVAEFESLAGAVFAEAAPEALSDGALAATLARLDDRPAEAAPTEAAPAAGADLPGPVLAALGGARDERRWRFRMPGVSEIVLPGADEERVSLLRVRPGAGVPAHTHTALEATLVLRGALIDRGARFDPGDVAVATDEDDHHPAAGPGEDCICLTVLSGGLRFTGAFGRALNLFAE